MMRPKSMSCGTTRLTAAMGMEKPTPADVPVLWNARGQFPQLPASSEGPICVSRTHMCAQLWRLVTYIAARWQWTSHSCLSQGQCRTRVGENGGVEAHNFAAAVNERPAAVARVDGRVALDAAACVVAELVIELSSSSVWCTFF